MLSTHVHALCMYSKYERVLITIAVAIVRYMSVESQYKFTVSCLIYLSIRKVDILLPHVF